MKKIKLKFKRALYAFFKEEIDNAIGHKYKAGQIIVNRIVENRIEFHEIKGHIILEDNSRGRYPIGKPIGYEYQDALLRARKEMFEQVLNFIQADERSVMNPHINEGRIIKLSLFVGKEKTVN